MGGCRCPSFIAKINVVLESMETCRQLSQEHIVKKIHITFTALEFFAIFCHVCRYADIVSNRDGLTTSCQPQSRFRNYGANRKFSSRDEHNSGHYKSFL